MTVSFGTNLFPALVERGRHFSVADLPLPDATNIFTLAATNANGCGATVPLTILKSSVVLTIDPLPTAQLSQPYTTVTGTINLTGQDVWVNGVQATVNPDGTWEADNVPVNNTQGTGNFNLAAYPAGSDPGTTAPTADQAPVVAMPPTLKATGYVNNYFDKRYSTCCGNPSLNTSQISENWQLGKGGQSVETTANASGQQNTYTTDWPADNYPLADWTVGSQQTGSSIIGNPLDCCGHEHFQETLSQRTETSIALTAGGPALSGEHHLIRLTVSVLADGVPVPPSLVSVLGQLLTPTATNANVGEVYVDQAVGSTRQLPVTVFNSDVNTVNMQAQVVTQQIVDAMNPTQDFTDKTYDVIVGQKISLLCQVTPTNARPTSYQWTVPGYAI